MKNLINNANLYKISSYLTILNIFVPFIYKIYSEMLFNLISSFILIFLSLVLKKLLNEKFQYNKVDTKLYTIIFLTNVYLLLSSKTGDFWFSLIDITSVLGFLIGMNIGKLLIKDNVGYSELFPNYSASLINICRYTIVIIVGLNLLNTMKSILPTYIEITLMIFLLVVIFPSILSGIRNTIYLYKIFQKASKEEIST